MRLWFDVQALQGPFFERGIQRYVRAVATELERRAAPVVAFGTNPSQREPYPQHGAVATSTLLTPATAAALRDAAAHDDLVYLCGSGFEGFAPIQNLWPNYTVIPEVPAAVIVYDTIPFRRPGDFQATQERRSFYGARRHLLEQADRFLAISASAGRELAEDFGIDPTDIAVIGCGVDTRFRPPDDVAAARHELTTALPHVEGPYLLYVGGFQPQKNVEGLLDAYALLDPDLRSSYRLVVGGSVPDELRRDWQERCERLGIVDRVVFTGLVDDATLVRLYQCARLLVFPSLHEGFGLPVAEAAACGTPAISSNTSSLPEVIEWEPSTFDPRSPDSIAAGITRALTDIAFDTELRAACAAAAGRHTWTNVVDRLLAELQPLSGRPRSGRRTRRVAIVGDDVTAVSAAARQRRGEHPGWRIDAFAGAGSVRTEPQLLPRLSFGRTAEPALYDTVEFVQAE